MGRILAESTWGTCIFLIIVSHCMSVPLFSLHRLPFTVFPCTCWKVADFTTFWFKLHLFMISVQIELRCLSSQFTVFCSYFVFYYYYFLLYNIVFILPYIKKTQSDRSNLDQASPMVQTNVAGRRAAVTGLYQKQSCQNPILVFEGR